MSIDKITIEYDVVERSAVDTTDSLLIKEADIALQKAHSPYSGFQVGCAVSLEGGKVYTGNNQENAAYPSGLCAERVALFAAKSQVSTPIETIVIVAKGKNGELADAFSCGNCRQVMMEYASHQERPIRVLMQTSQGKFVVVKDVKELLPFHFHRNSTSHLNQ